MGAGHRARVEPQGAPGTGAESRIVRLASGVRWRATVVARLISEDVVAGQEHARLVLHLECLTMPRRSVRVALSGARSLKTVGEEALREAVEPNPMRTIRRARSV